MINRSETVAVLVDYQDKILASMQKREELLKNSLKLVQGLKILGIPLYKTQQYTKGLGMTVDEINEAANLTADDYFEKKKFSAFDVIRDKISGKKYVIVCGIEAHVCVLQTVLELIENGYVPVLMADCIDSRSSENVKIAIKRAEKEGAVITSVETLLFELLGSADAVEFRDISKLIR